MTPYEQAAQRFENISRNWKTIADAAAAIRKWADREYDAATCGLYPYEDRPGVAKAEYAGQIGYPETAAWPDSCPISPEMARAALALVTVSDD